MQCPKCGGKTEVTHNRKFPQYVRRRRVCTKCGRVTTTYEAEKPPGERYPMGRSKAVKENKLPSNKEPASGCKYNKGVTCHVPIQNRTCGKCGWKPSVSERRLEKILKKRQEVLKNA